MKKLLCLLVVCVMAISCLVACSQSAATTAGGEGSSATTANASAKSAVPEYLNLATDLPVVKSGFDIPLKIAVLHTPDFGKIEDSHFWNFVKQKMNIKVEVEQVFNRDEYVNITFAANSLPDVMIGMNITAVMQMNYGVMEKQLLPLTKYINQEYMPNLQAIYDLYPEYKATVTAPNGEIYSFGSYMDATNPSMYPKRQMNTKWLKEANLSYPSTLDEFTAVLKTFKDRAANIVPLGGSFAVENPFYIILNAFGYVTADSTGKSAALRNNKVVIPAGDREVYGEVLKLLNDYYNKGYITKDFYTLDQTATRALVAENRVGVIATDAFISLPKPEGFQQYETMPPLTSKYSTSKFAVINPSLTTGGYVISAACKYPEAAIRFANYCLGDEGSNMSWVGAVRGSENLLPGWGGWYLDEKYSRLDVDRVANPDKWPNAVEYLRKRVAGFNMGAINSAINEFTWRPKANGLAPRNMYEVWKASPTNGDFWFRPSVVDNLMPYVTDGFPSILFFSKADNERITELSSVLGAHIDAENAKFITGARALTDAELNKYYEELDALGFKEYLKYYQTAYDNYIKNLK